MTNTPITSRLAIPADIPALIKLGEESSTAAHWSEKQYQDFFLENQRRLILLCEGAADNSLVGFLVAHQIAPEWELENIVVAASAQRKGIGKQLLEALILQAKHTNSEAVFLEVRESNRAARSLYEAAGFRETGRRKSYYENPLEDAVLYRLDFS